MTTLNVFDTRIGDIKLQVPASLVASVPIRLVGLGTMVATRDPGVGDDVSTGVSAGTMWGNVTAGALRMWMCRDEAAGAAKWTYMGADYANGGTDPANGAVQFGAGSAPLPEEGILNRQTVAAGVQPGATGADNVLAVYSLPASSLDIAGRGINIMAIGSFGATANNKRVKIIVNPSAAVVGSTVTGGTTIADTGTVATNGGGWSLEGSLIKYGAAGSNTQLGVNDKNLAGATSPVLLAPAAVAAVESGAILVAVTGNATTAATDILFSQLRVRGMN